MPERDQYQFMDTSDLKATEGIEKRTTEAFIREELQKRFPEENFPLIKVSRNDTGNYQAKASLIEKAFGAGKPIEGLPAYYEVEIHHSTGEYTEELIVWSPIAWNDRFAGTAGGGTGIGGRSYLTRPDNTTRGWTVPYAVMNGFTAATMWAGNSKGTKDYVIDSKTGKFCRELYENWRVRSTHNMTVFGRAVAEILHNRPVKYAYMNGGSGGGRQSLMEMQNYPNDYDGIWASCPAINWNNLMLAGFWPSVVMNEHQHFLTSKKNEFFIRQLQESVGGADKFYALSKPVTFDARQCIGMESGDGVITEKDALVMNEIWKGPHKSDGTVLWYGCYPGGRNWQKIIPIGTYYYPLFGGKRVKPFILATYHVRWITGNPKGKYDNLNQKQFEELFEEGIRKFGDTNGENPAVDEFVNHGGKLLMDHGMDDPLIPTEGTIDYYKKLCKHFGGREKVDEFCKMYITPGDNHGNCWGNGPGITESAGLKALMDWVENGIEPGALRKVRVDRKNGEFLSEGIAEPYKGDAN